MNPQTVENKGESDHFTEILENLEILEILVTIIRAPYKIQNPSEPQNTPRDTPQIPLQNRNAEKIRKKYENHPISYFSIFFVFRFSKGDSGCILGFGGVLYFVWGTYDRKILEISPVKRPLS